MIYKIKITDQADVDIRNIYEYIAYELQSPDNDGIYHTSDVWRA